MLSIYFLLLVKIYSSCIFRCKITNKHFVFKFFSIDNMTNSIGFQYDLSILLILYKQRNRYDSFIQEYNHSIISTSTNKDLILLESNL